MLERESQIKELYDLKHRKDNEIHKHFDYENEIQNKMFSSYIFKNDIMKQFITKLKKLFVLGIEAQLNIRNFYNFTVSKYYDRHNN